MSLPVRVLSELQTRVAGLAVLPGIAAEDLRPHQSRTAALHLLAEELLRRHLRTHAAPGIEPSLPALPGASARALELLAQRRPFAGADLPADGLPPAAIGRLHAELLQRGARKAQGSWYTDARLAQPTAARTLQPLLGGDCRQLRVVDPAAGAGAFLLAALDCLAAASGLAPAELAPRCLFGLDLDPTAAGLAAWSVWHACSAPDLPIAGIAAHITAGDGLAQLPAGSFDAVVGNPPWETLQPSRKEFFAERVGDFRSLDHQQALASQRALFARDADAAADWQRCRQQTAARAAELRARFRHQGRGKLYTYRLFVERAVDLLRDGGRLGLIVPASLCFDRDAAPLRRLLLDRCTWEWLFLFENRSRLFPIDSRCRFGPIVAQKGGRTTALRAAAGRIDADEWRAEQPPHLLYPRRLVRQLSPRHGVLFELQHARDLELLQRLGARGTPLLADLRFAQGDFNLTSKSHLFVPRRQLLADGAAPLADGFWQLPDGRRFAPLYQGAMVYDLHPHVADHAGGAGHRTRWQPAAEPGVLRPQFFVAEAALRRRPPVRVGFRALSNATNERTAVVSLLGGLPCGNSLGLLTPVAGDPAPVLACAFAAGVLGSLVFDWALRHRLAGTNLNRFVLEECVLPRVGSGERRAIANLALRLSAILPWQRPLWTAAATEGWLDAAPPAPTELAAAARRQLLAELDARTALAFGLGPAELGWMLRDCDLPTARLRRAAAQLDGRGFWRIDRLLPPDQRRPAWALDCLRRLQGATAAR